MAHALHGAPIRDREHVGDVQEEASVHRRMAELGGAAAVGRIVQLCFPQERTGASHVRPCMCAAGSREYDKRILVAKHALSLVAWRQEPSPDDAAVARVQRAKRV